MSDPALQALPGESFTATLEGWETGFTGVLGVQIRSLEDQVVRIRRTTGISEQPPGSGNYVTELVAPVEFGDYQVIWDKNNGVLTPGDTAIEELKVTATIPVEASGLGPVADGAWAHLGEHFVRLRSSANYGVAFIAQQAETIKRRVMTAPPAVADEHNLDPLVIDYLGKLLALALIPPAMAYWASQPQSQSTGDKPAESVSYPDRIRGLQAIQESLLVSSRRDEAIVMPLLEAPRTRAAAMAGPAIDEMDDCRVTTDPRDFPPYDRYPRPRLPVMPS